MHRVLRGGNVKFIRYLEEHSLRDLIFEHKYRHPRVLYYKVIRALTNNIIELRGNRLDRLDEARLRQLIHIHKAALDRTQQALAVMQG